MQIGFQNQWFSTNFEIPSSLHFLGPDVEILQSHCKTNIAFVVRQQYITVFVAELRYNNKKTNQNFFSTIRA